MRMKQLACILLAALALTLSACASGQRAAVDTANALSLNQYNRFVQAQADNLERLAALRREMNTQGAASQELFAVSLLMAAIEKHAAMAANMADLSLLAATAEYRETPYVASRLREAASALRQDLDLITMQNLALNKSAFKDVSAIYTGYMVDLGQLIGLVESDLATLSDQ